MIAAPRMVADRTAIGNLRWTITLSLFVVIHNITAVMLAQASFAIEPDALEYDAISLRVLDAILRNQTPFRLQSVPR
jgi:hypothetical protein